MSLYDYPFEWLGKSRASLPKVKTGCVSCKNRRVKCDESKPICSRCRKGNRSCFYQSQQIANSKDSARNVQLRCAAFRSPPGIKHFSSEAERFGFDSFRQTPAQLLGDNLGWRDWGNIVLQNSENDPALRHAVIALGIMYEETVHDLDQAPIPRDRKLLPLAYTQYHEAIKELRSQLQGRSTRSVEANMLACMLLVVFDFMQGDYRATGVHLAGGVAMLRSYLNPRDSSEELIARVSTPWRTSLERSGMPPTEGSFGARLLLSFGYLDFWGSCWMDGLPAIPEVSVLEGLAVRRPPQLQSDTEIKTSIQIFATLENRIREFLRAARGLLYQHGHQLPRTTSRRQLPHQSSSVTFSEMKVTLTELLKEWHKGYQDLCATFVCDEPWHIQAIKSVAVNHKKVEIMLAAAQTDGTVEYQAYTPDFKEVVTLSRKVFEDRSFLAHAPSPLHVNSPFAFIIGIIHALFIASLHCSDVSVCQEAIDMLASRRWKEGAWDSITMADIARQQLAARQYIPVPR